MNCFQGSSDDKAQTMTPVGKLQHPAPPAAPLLRVRLCWLASSCSIALASQGQAQPISLDASVTQQLLIENNQACAELFRRGGNPTGDLGVLCQRVYVGGPIQSPGSTGTSSSSTPVASVPPRARTADSDREDVQAITSRLSVFVTVAQGDVDRSASPLDGGYESGVQRRLAGVSYAASPNANLSLACQQTRQDGDFIGGGDFTQDSDGMQLIGNLRFTDALSVDALLAWDKVSAERTRAAQFSDVFSGGTVFLLVSSLPHARFDYDQLGTTLQGNYDIAVQALTLQFQLGADWRKADYGSYSETAGDGLQLRFHDDEKTSLQSRLGASAAYTISLRHGVLVPQINLGWLHEFKADGRTLNVSFVEDLNQANFQFQAEDEDADFMQASVAGVWVFRRGLQAFLHYETLFEHEFLDSQMVSAGLRLEF